MFFTKYYYDGEMKGAEMCEAFSVRGKDVNSMQSSREEITYKTQV